MKATSQIPKAKFVFNARICCLLLACLLFPRAQAQTEFVTYNNGLIYSEPTMHKLERIVDSLNLKYKTCDLNKTFYSKSQTIGHLIVIRDSQYIKQAREDLRKNITMDAFISKYPAEVTKNVLIVKHSYTGKDPLSEFAQINPNNGYGMEIEHNTKKYPLPKSFKNTWIFTQEEPEYTSTSLAAFYFPEDFKCLPLKPNYARQVGYADCLIDTNTTKFLKDAKYGYPALSKNWRDLPLKEKQKQLKKLRSTRVMGQCSMDSSPREHAMNIALLSAETINWEVFLQAHLDIMNDRFERMSDGSYAQARRKTYIKELEELDINTKDLLLGISLRIENPAGHHYYGNIGRLGRAITESVERNEFEKQILSMIEDNGLDDYNRLVAFFLFRNYLYYLEDKDEQSLSRDKLKNAVTHLPPYLKENIKWEQD